MFIHIRYIQTDMKEKINNVYNRTTPCRNSLGEQKVNCESRWENPQKLTQLRPGFHPRHLVGKSTVFIPFLETSPGKNQ